MNGTKRSLTTGAIVVFATAAILIDFSLPLEPDARQASFVTATMFGCYLCALITCFRLDRWQSILTAAIAIGVLWLLVPAWIVFSGDIPSGEFMTRRGIGVALLAVVGGGLIAQKHAAVELERLNADLESTIESRTRLYREAAAVARRAQAELDAITRIALDGVVTSDNGVIVSASPNFAEKLGYEEQNFIGSNTLLHVAEHFRAVAIEEFRRPTGRAYELLLVCADGSTVLMEAYSTNFASDGRSLHVCGFRDISERLALEREIARLGEHERRRVGRELQDNLGQVLASLRWAAGSLVEASAGTHADVEQAASTVASLAARCLDDCRRLSRQLAPKPLDAFGIEPMLEILKQTVDAHHGFRCTLECAHNALIGDEDVVLHLYRIAEEAVSNALKYSGGSTISLSFRRAGDHYVLAVRDDGCGLSGGADDGAGFRSMRYRARLIDGIIDIDVPSEGGARISCTIPAV